MQTSGAQALRLHARSILALLAAIGLLLGGSSFTAAAQSPAGGLSAAVSAVAEEASAASAATSSASAATTSSIVGLPLSPDLPHSRDVLQPLDFRQSHGVTVTRLQRVVLVRQLAAHGGPKLAVSTGGVLLPAGALLELERLSEPVARRVLSVVRPGRGPPQQAGT